MFRERHPTCYTSLPIFLIGPTLVDSLVSELQNFKLYGIYFGQNTCMSRGSGCGILNGDSYGAR